MSMSTAAFVNIIPFVKAVFQKFTMCSFRCWF